MSIINLTPHDVNICDEKGNIIKTYKASGMYARVDHGWETIDYVDGVPLVVRKNERVIVTNADGILEFDLPRPKEGTMYIVSNVVLTHCSDRLDIVSPCHQVKIYGKVVGCRTFVSNK
jgi:hypothetical protein